jgi:hypothetical protein
LINGGNWFLPNELRTFHAVDYCLVGIDYSQYPSTNEFGVLPIGHKLTIMRVCDDADSGSEHIIAYCRTTMPSKEKDVTVGYAWGGGLVLERAPWEPDTVPESRRTLDPQVSHWIPPK